MKISPRDPEESVAEPRPGHFADRGCPGARRVGAGFVGVVHRMGNSRVAKVWAGRPPTALTRRVCADVARHRLPCTTPEILDAQEHEGVVVTYERELPGVPMAYALTPYDLFGLDDSDGHLPVVRPAAAPQRRVRRPEAMTAAARPVRGPARTPAL